MSGEPMTYDFRLQRKTVRELISSVPEGIDKDELARLAEAKGIGGEDLQRVLNNLLNSGRAYYDESGKIHYVRNE